MPGRLACSTSRTFSSAEQRLRRSRPLMTSTRSMGFDSPAGARRADLICLKM
jgi:hypothetical protein